MANPEPTYFRTNLDEIPGIITDLRKNFNESLPTSYDYRLNQLIQLQKLISENKDEITSELCNNFGTFNLKHALMRLHLVEREIVDAINSLHKWMNELHKQPLMFANTINWDVNITPHPRGVVCIIGPWNYPVNLVLRPLIGAIAAGNAIAIKPSEVTDNIARLLVKLINKYLDNKMIRVVCGGVPETTQLLKQKFDFIFFTGSPMVGKIIMRAASAHLTPVCLELGGKNPVFIDDESDLNVSMKRVTYGRWWFNGGQTCLCPEYVFVSKSKVKECTRLIRKYLIEMYVTQDNENNTGKIVGSKHLERIVNNMHFNRVNELRQHYLQNESNKVVVGTKDDDVFGEEDSKVRYIPPTVIQIDSSEYTTAKIMEGEIFGPILTLVAMDGTSDEWKSEAVDLMRNLGEPLACYVFSPNKKFIEYIDTYVSAGAIIANDCCFQASFAEVPFGGVGESGMGHYGGHHSFETFSHMKPLAKRSHKMEFIHDFVGRYAPSNYETLEKFASTFFMPRQKTFKSEAIKYGVGTVAVLGAGYYVNKYYLKYEQTDVDAGVQALKSTVQSFTSKLF